MTCQPSGVALIRRFEEKHSVSNVTTFVSRQQLDALEQAGQQPVGFKRFTEAVIAGLREHTSMIML